MSAPVVIFCYRRSIIPLLTDLQENSDYADTLFYIFSDGWKSEFDKNDVLQVRDELLRLKKIPNFIIFESDTNKGLANSIIDGVAYVIGKHGSSIVLEDDLQVSSAFLEYMNSALDYYKYDERIWSISGYSPPVFSCNETCKFDVFLFPRGCSWGWATWVDRWEKIDWDVQYFHELKKSKKLRNKFEKGGNDLFKMLELQMLGKIDSWAIRWYGAQFYAGMKTVYPKKSLVINNGFNDGYGTHTTGNYCKWSSDDLSDSVPDVSNWTTSSIVFNKIKKHHDIGTLTKIGYFANKYGGYNILKKIQMIILKIQKKA